MKINFKKLVRDFINGMIKLIMWSISLFIHALIIFVFGRMVIADPTITKADLALVFMCSFTLSLTSLVILWHINQKDEIIKKTFLTILGIFAASLFFMMLTEAISLITGETTITLWILLVGFLFGLYVVISALFICPLAWLSIIFAKNSLIEEMFPTS